MEVNTMKFGTLHGRDVIAGVVLIGGIYLLSRGVDSYVTAMITLILGYYFSKRVFEEKQTEAAAPVPAPTAK